MWSHFCLTYEGQKLVTGTDYIKHYGIKDGDQVCGCITPVLLKGSFYHPYMEMKFLLDSQMSVTELQKKIAVCKISAFM